MVDNVRSAYNVGSIFRSADAFGVARIICTGITPYPKIKGDRRLPHVVDKAARMIAKTALGAEKSVPCKHADQANSAISEYRQQGYHIYALEQSNASSDIRRFEPRPPCLLVVGNELSGVNQMALEQADAVLEIPMRGRKESLNVAVATGIALYHLLG